MEAKKADDHDMHWSASLVPFGIQDVVNSDLSLFFGVSYETSDFIVDCLQMWWDLNKKDNYSHIEELVINLDNGPSQKSNRTQFIKRIVEFSKKIKIPIHLVYYPPYHSKYNPIEHSFGVLERYWNGEILNSIETTLKFASNMELKAKKPYVQLVDKEYHLGKKLTKKELSQYDISFLRSSNLPAWDVSVSP